jgi:glyoxylase-like metal-dependent hydrolase (beta-lactamase superfamily II)
VIDPPSSGAVQLESIMNAAAGKITGVWLTHAHPDHTGGVAALSSRAGAPVYAHPRSWEAISGSFEKISVAEGSEIDGWQVAYLPGHRFDHLAFIHRSSRVAVVGDLVAGAGSVIIDPVDGDLFDYFASLRRLRNELQPTMLLPGHGPLSAEPETLLSHFIRHRLAREQQILDALSVEPRAITDILPRAYADTPPSLYPLAARALMSHLLKLEREGRVTHSPAGWRVPVPSRG